MGVLGVREVGWNSDTTTGEVSQSTLDPIYEGGGTLDLICEGGGLYTVQPPTCVVVSWPLQEI